MDEPTLDCTVCGNPGVLTARVEVLRDDAEWHRKDSWVVCQAHKDYLQITPGWLMPGSRMILEGC